MKKSIVLLIIGLLSIPYPLPAAEKESEKPNPPQSIHEIMRARQGWLASINKSLESQQFDAIAKDADAMAAETMKTADSHPNPVGKEITMAISTLSKEISTAATGKNSDTVKLKMGEIKAKCGECHAKFRNK